jgi:hypothetical protein
MKSKPVRFWYCAKDEKGKPRLLFDQVKVPQSAIDAVLKKAQDKTVATGTMRLEKSGELNVVTKSVPPSSLARGVQVVARESNAMPKAINLVTQAMLESKELGARYKDEDKKTGWRVPDKLTQRPGESPEDFAARQKKAEQVRESDVTTTKYYNDAERKEAEIRFKPSGVAKDADGDRMEGQHGFVIDPKTGKTYQFDDKVDVLPGGKKQTHHHSSPLAGGAVGGAGHLEFKDGHIKKVDDQSGHYKPDARTTYNAVKQLDKQGALVRPKGDGTTETKVSLLDKNAGITDEQWDEVKGDKDKIKQQAKLNQLKQPLGEQAYAKLMLKKPDELKKMMASGKYKNVDELKAKLGEIELKKLEAEVKNDSSKLEAKAKELNVTLKKVKLDDNNLNNQTVTNFEVGQANALETKKSQFLQSKGNENQMRNKDRMLSELLEKTPKKKMKDNDGKSMSSGYANFSDDDRKNVAGKNYGPPDSNPEEPGN